MAGGIPAQTRRAERPRCYMPYMFDSIKGGIMIHWDSNWVHVEWRCEGKRMRHGTPYGPHVGKTFDDVLQRQKRYREALIARGKAGMRMCYLPRGVNIAVGLG